MQAATFIQRDHCLLCHSEQLTPLCDIPFTEAPIAPFLACFYNNRLPIDALANGRYQIAQCDQCHFVFQQQILDDNGMMQLYEHWIDADKSLQKKRTAKPKLFKRYAAEAALINQLCQKPPHHIRVLEYGMGWGFWSRTAQAFNYQVTGFELSQRRVDYARQMGIHVVDEIAQLEPQSFDFIYANQVLEHVPNPTATLTQLRELLAPEGCIFLRVPDCRHTAKILLEKGWSENLDEIHPLEHINGFSRATLKMFCQSLGFTSINPPLRINAQTPWSSLQREWRDRFVQPHLLLKLATP